LYLYIGILLYEKDIGTEKTYMRTYENTIVYHIKTQETNRPLPLKPAKSKTKDVQLMVELNP
jgi:hypothetical protein